MMFGYARSRVCHDEVYWQTYCKNCFLTLDIRQSNTLIIANDGTLKQCFRLQIVANRDNLRAKAMERLNCLLVTDFLLLSQLFVIPCAFIIILDAVDKLLCINTIISQENFIGTRALNIMLDAIDIISRMHTVI